MRQGRDGLGMRQEEWNGLGMRQEEWNGLGMRRGVEWSGKDMRNEWSGNETQGGVVWE